MWTAALFCVPGANRPVHTVLVKCQFMSLKLFELDNSFDFGEHACILSGLGCDLRSKSFICCLSCCALLHVEGKSASSSQVFVEWISLYLMFLFCQYFEPNTRPV